jgi:two-component system, NarL family, invasion response regulator UvrY
MIRILIADDHDIVRKGLIQILSDEFTDLHIGEAGNGSELLQLARKEKWDIIISDLTMPGKNGLDVLKQLRIEYPGTPVLIISMHPEGQYAVRALRAGASGYLNKTNASEELIVAVQKILSGKKYITDKVADALAETLVTDSDKQLHELLSDREFDVLKLIASGKTISEIAEILSLSVTTVSTYRARILEKTGMKTNAELTRYAIENKLV